MKFIALVFLLQSSLSWASLIKGNGGNTIVCPDKVEVLDIFEGRMLQGWNYEAQELQKRAMSRAVARFPKQSLGYLLTWLGEFERDVQWIQEAKLGEVVDSYHFVVPQNCRVEQTVLARRPLPGEKRYLVRADLYARLTPWQREALKWHEVIYRYILKDHTESYNSESTRKIVAALFADEADLLSEEDWMDLLKEL